MYTLKKKLPHNIYWETRALLKGGLQRTPEWFYPAKRHPPDFLLKNAKKYNFLDLT